MEQAPKVSATSLSEALATVEQQPAEYQLQNQWLIDLDHRISTFSYNDQELVSKRSGFKKSLQERARAESAHRVLAGAYIGHRAVVAAVPDIMPSSDGESCHLLTPFLGADMNESYYAQRQPELPFEDWKELVHLMSSKGIQHRDFLPRNTIVTPEQIVLIDWENAHFNTRACIPDNSTWTSLAISWSYFYGLSDIESFRELTGTAEDTYLKVGAYEQTFANLTGIHDHPRIVGELAYSMAIAAEADRARLPLRYKLDDAFHVISEVIPNNIEVVMDMLLATRSDQDHYVVSELMAAASASFHEAFTANKASKDLNLYKRRCAQLAWILANPLVLSSINPYDSAVQAVDAVKLPDSISKITDMLAYTIISSYPGAQPRGHTLETVANELHGLFAAGHVQPKV